MACSVRENSKAGLSKLLRRQPALTVSAGRALPESAPVAQRSAGASGTCHTGAYLGSRANYAEL